MFSVLLLVGMAHIATCVTPLAHRHADLVPRIKLPGDELDGSGESGDGDPHLTSDPAFEPTSSPPGGHLGTVPLQKDDEDDFATYIDTEESQDVLSTGIAETVSFTERLSTTPASIVQTNSYASTGQHRTVGVISSSSSSSSGSRSSSSSVSSSKRTSRDSKGKESNGTKEEARFCPTFCCSSNVTCRYDYEVLPVCSCNKASPYESCELSDGDNPIWADVLTMPPDRKRGVCMELWERDQSNVTRYRLHCHVTGVQDFTYTSVHWNASAPDDVLERSLPNQRPCLMFIKRAGPPLRNKTAMDETLQYAGFAMIFVFIGVIMCSCRNQESTDEDEPLERKASDAWVDSG